jgi:hypothetical protein
MSTPNTLSTIALGCLILSATACGPRVDLKKDLVVVDVVTGWYDAGIIKDTEGDKNRIVPSIAFRLKNVTPDKTIASVQINAVYRPVNEREKEWGTTWVKAIGSDGLKPGETSGQLVLRSDRGHLGLQPRLQMLQNRGFMDVFVDVMGRYGPDQWVKLATYPIARQLLTQYDRPPV